MSLPTAALAQASIDSKTAVFGSWSTECRGFGEKRTCFASQVVAASPDGKDVVLGVTVGKLPRKLTYSMSFRFSNAANQSAGIGFKIEPDGRSARAPIQTCDEKVCETKIELNQQLLQQLKGKKMLAFAFFDKSGRQNTYPVNLQGIEQALSELDKLTRKK